jgi:hypothetical protein
MGKKREASTTRVPGQQAEPVSDWSAGSEQGALAAQRQQQPVGPHGSRGPLDGWGGASKLLPPFEPCETVARQHGQQQC